MRRSDMDNTVTIQCLGTAGFRFFFRDITILLDPYFTRVRTSSEPLLPDPAYLRRFVDKADYVIVSHSHYDHFADVPPIAKITSPTLIGSKTTPTLHNSFAI